MVKLCIATHITHPKSRNSFQKGMYMKRNPFLLTAITTAIISSLLLTSCQSDRTTSTDNLDFIAQNSSATEADSSDGNSSDKKSLRTVTEIPSGELSDTDKFFRGIWVDENGFVANFTNSGRQSVFDETDILEIVDKISDESSDEALKKISITAKDADTIEIISDGKNYTAYHAYSAKGQELIEKFQNSALGEWVICDNGYEQTINIKKYNLLTAFKNDLDGDIYTVGLEGVKLRITMLGDTDGFVRLDGEKLKLYSVYGNYISSFDLVKKGSNEYKKLTDAGEKLDGTWVYPYDTETTLAFSDNGTKLTVTGDAYGIIFGDKYSDISGNTYDISAKYENGSIVVTADGNTLFYIERYEKKLVVFTKNDSSYPQIELYPKDSDTVTEAQKTEKLMNEKADLLTAYPDNDDWLRITDSGDILSLADKEYIDKYANSGYFIAGTPQEIASFVYYVNTQPLEQGQVALELSADIDLSGYDWAPMGWSDYGNTEHPFSFCVFGKGHTIKNMTINSEDSNVGFIGWGTVCGVFELNIENAEVNGNDNVGVLTGQAIMGNYQNCHVSGNVSGGSAGSLLGYEANSDITDCSADVTVNGEKFGFLSWNEQQKSEIKIDDPVTITIDESYTVTRPEVSGYTNLGWMVLEDGQQVLHRNAEDELGYSYFGNEPGHSYEIYLTAYVQGQYVPISNIIEYTVK